MPLRNKTKSNTVYTRLFSAPILSALLSATLTSNALALEDAFIGGYVGAVSSLDADSTGSSFKILTGAHVTSNITLEFGYVNFGSTKYDDPSAINQGTNRANISFRDADHGSVLLGQLGDPTAVPGAASTYNNKGDAEFNGISEFTPEGGLINLRYRFEINDQFDFFVKSGFFAWAADYQYIKIIAAQGNASNVTRTEEKSSQASGVNTISGAGFIYRPIPQLSIRTELESTAISSAEMPRTRLQNISLGLNWEF